MVTLVLIRRIWHFFLDFVFPIECLGCGKEKEWFCSQCAGKIIIADHNLCFVCKKPSERGRVCFLCAKEFPLKRVLYFFDYNDLLPRKAIHLAKYSFVHELLPKLGKLAGPYLQSAIEDCEIDPRALIFVPVPLHPRRERMRGFNQAKIIAQEWATFLNAQYAELLERKRYTVAQVNLDEQDRMRNIQAAFEVINKQAVQGQYVVLVDDVATTGSTLAECGRALSLAGAQEVWAAVLAKG